MQSLQDQVVTKFQATATLYPAVSGPHAFAAPAKATYPWTYFFTTGPALVKETYDGSRIERVGYHFITQHTDDTALSTYHELIKGLFPRKWAQVRGAYLNYSNLDIVRDQNGEPFISSNGEIIYRSRVDWIFHVQTTNASIGS
jgi:hypothetical protein